MSFDAISFSSSMLDCLYQENNNSTIHSTLGISMFAVMALPAKLSGNTESGTYHLKPKR